MVHGLGRPGQGGLDRGDGPHPERRPVVHRRQAVHRGRAGLRGVLRAILPAMAALSVGDPLDPATDVGPLNSAAQRDEVAAQVDDAKAKGAVVGCGGRVPVGPGFYYPPTVLSGVTPAMRVGTEEVFGPVALVEPAPGPRRGDRPGQCDASTGSGRACGPTTSASAAPGRRDRGRPGLRQRHGRLDPRDALRRASSAPATAASCPSSGSRSSATPSRCGWREVARAGRHRAPSAGHLPGPRLDQPAAPRGGRGDGPLRRRALREPLGRPPGGPRRPAGPRRGPRRGGGGPRGPPGRGRLHLGRHRVGQPGRVRGPRPRPPSGGTARRRWSARPSSTRRCSSRAGPRPRARPSWPGCRRWCCERWGSDAGCVLDLDAPLAGRSTPRWCWSR